MQQEVKNPLNYGYLGDEKIEITSKEFMAMKVAIEQGINATLESYLPEVTKYVDVESSKIVENPSEEDVKSGKVTLVTDRDATFSPANVKFQYSTKLTPDMVMGQQLIMEIHERNVNSGVAKSIEELKKANELTLVPQDGSAESGN
jgi:hypothetical protein